MGQELSKFPNVTLFVSPDVSTRPPHLQCRGHFSAELVHVFMISGG